MKKGSYRVGIIKFMDHTSLNRIEAGTVAGLDRLSEKYGVPIDYEGLVYDGKADMETMRRAGEELAEKGVDAVVTIATAPAVAVKETLEKAGILLVFRAVSDPVGAGLVTDLDHPEKLRCGSSDSISGRELVSVLLKVMPDVKKVGLLFNKEDFSAKLPMAEAKPLLDAAGVEWIEENPENGEEVRACAEALLARGVEAVITPTDNTTAGEERTIAPLFLEAGVPHFTGSHSFCVNGAFTGLGSRYKDGDEKFDGLMEDLLFKGVAPRDTTVLRNPTTFVGVNETTCEGLGFEKERVEKSIRELGLGVLFMGSGREIDPEGDL